MSRGILLLIGLLAAVLIPVVLGGGETWARSTEPVQEPAPAKAKPKSKAKAKDPAAAVPAGAAPVAAMPGGDSPAP